MGKSFAMCAQASGNVAGLCSWAEAMCTYHVVAKEVEPKIQALNLAEGELRAASRERDAALEQLSIVQASLDAMQVGTSFGLSNCVVTCLQRVLGSLHAHARCKTFAAHGKSTCSISELCLAGCHILAE